MLATYRTRAALRLALALFLLRVATLPTFAGITILSRQSDISVSGQGKEDVIFQSMDFDQLGSFNESVSGQGGDVPDGTHARGSAAQDSSVFIDSQGRLRGNGSLSTDAFARFLPPDTAGPALVSATSALDVAFEVAGRDQSFHVTGAFDLLNLRGRTAAFFLTETSTPPQGQQPLLLVIDNVVETGSLAFDQSLTLHPGRYRISAEAMSGSSGSSPGDPYSFGESVSMSFEFEIGQANGVLIPLPPGVWAGLLGMTVAGAVAVASRRGGRV